MKTFLTLALFGTVLPLTAALPPASSAPLAKHLLEVNAQWARMDPAPADGGRSVCFTDEAARISTHLLMVRERLIERSEHAVLTTDQRANRLNLLHRLGDYAHAGVFPRNHVLPVRNPVFIDPYGTACAVGWLMIESGHRDLAEAIRDGMNLGYLHHIAADPRFAEPVADWARQHGFTADELAWIQPGYPFQVPTFPLGGGTNGAVTVMHPLSDGGLLVGGAFTQAGGTAATSVARWNGLAWSALGDGIPGAVHCATEHQGQLYVGGHFDNGYDLAVWDGATWQYQLVFEGTNPLVRALHVHNNTLYAAGEATGFASIEHRVRRLTTAGWEAAGDPFNAEVYALASHNGDLVAGGAFTQPVGPTDPLMHHVARFDGYGWVELANGLDATVRCLRDVDGTLYAGGDLYQNIAPVFGLARLAPGASDWQGMLPGKTGYMPTGIGPSHINAITPLLNGIAFGGRFMIDTGGGISYFGENMGWVSATPDDYRIGSWHNGEVRTMVTVLDQLHYGGDFTAVTGSADPVPYAAYTTFITAIIDRHDEEAPHAWPVPARERLSVDLAAFPGAATWICTTADGRQVYADGLLRDGRLDLDIAHLSPGAYVLNLHGDGRTVTLRFLKE